MKHNLHGFTIVEALLATVVLLLGVTLFAYINAQAARTVTDGQLASYAADALDATAQAINVGNPNYTRTRALNTADLNLLATSGGRRQTIQPSMTGQITDRQTDPPTFQVQISGPGVQLTAVATAPGGTP